MGNILEGSAYTPKYNPHILPLNVIYVFWFNVFELSTIVAAHASRMIGNNYYLFGRKLFENTPFFNNKI